MNAATLIRLALVSSVAALAGCSFEIVPGVPGSGGTIGSEVVGTYARRSSGALAADLTLQYNAAGTFEQRSTTSLSATGSAAYAGCVVHTRYRGTFDTSSTSGVRTLTQSNVVGTTWMTDCDDANQNAPEAAVHEEARASFERTFTYTLEGDTLTLTTEGGTSFAWTRQQ